ncbi:MAG TPA: prepilin-type N-terminal cleavage/methylation domain-containing protein [Gemmatimonadaceae bacterium]|nr:prepilin-type N-terminal cleavage/methylation domain-containing protein [Gemmatimonadaceae bacterium]
MSTIVRRRGFTLPEVLVTITIVAVLAAVVVPAVLNQVSKGDTAGLAGDVGALRTAISNFTTDTRHYPRNLGHLINPIDKDSLDLLGVAYGQGAANAWKGPYFPTSQSISGTATYSFTAFGLTLQNDFEAPATGTNNNFITLVFTNAGYPPANIATIDRQFDGGDGTVPTTTCSGTGTGSNTGQIRWTEAAATPCNITAIKWRLVSAAQ